MASVLIVDDEETFARNAARFLARAGHDAATAGTLAEARDQIRQRMPDVVVLDYRLPDGTGLELVASLRAADPTVLIWIVTGHGTIELAVEAMKQGANDLLTKPVSLSDLRERLASLTKAQRDESRLRWYESRERAAEYELVGDSAIMAALRQRIERERTPQGKDALAFRPLHPQVPGLVGQLRRLQGSENVLGVVPASEDASTGQAGLAANEQRAGRAIESLGQIIERRRVGGGLNTQRNQDILAGVVVAVTLPSKRFSAVSLRRIAWAFGSSFRYCKSGPPLVILKKLSSLILTHSLNLTIQPCTHQQTGLQAIVQFAFFPPIAQGISQQTRDHRQRGKVAYHAIVVDGLAAKGYQRGLQSHQEMARHFSTPLVR